MSKNAKNLTIFSKKLTKIVIFFNKIAIFEKMLSFWHFFDSQMAIFRRVRLRVTTPLSKMITVHTHITVQCQTFATSELPIYYLPND